MKDKDLLVVIAEMLRKQDQHTEILTNQSKLLEKTHETLTAFMDVSIKQFEQQQTFNEKFLLKLEHQDIFNEKFLAITEKMADRLDRIEKKL